MPIYEFECSDGHIFENVTVGQPEHKAFEAGCFPLCPCGKPMIKKLMSSFLHNGDFKVPKTMDKVHQKRVALKKEQLAERLHKGGRDG